MSSSRPIFILTSCFSKNFYYLCNVKKHLVIFLAFLFALTSCDSDLRRAKSYYHDAQKVAATDPDSALILIDSVLNIMVFLDDDIRMDMSLMQAEALFTHPDGERRELSKRIKAKKIYTMPELERAADYYAEKEEYYKATYAALYSGYVMRELRADDEAMVFFKDAVKYSEFTGDSLAFARANYNVARLLYQKFLDKDALPVIKTADAYYGNKYDERALAKNLMSLSFFSANDYYGAEKCLNQGLYYANKCNSRYAWLKIMNNYSVCYREQGKLDEAIECLRQIETDDTTKLVMHYLNFGKTFTKYRQYDSAGFYYDKMLQFLSYNNVRIETKVSAYNALSNFAELQNDFQQALKYRKTYGWLENLVQDSLRKGNICHINKKYDYEALQNNMNRQIISNYRIEMMMSVVIIMVLTMALVLYYRIIQKNKKETEIRAALLRVIKDNESLLKNISETQSAKLRSMQRLEILKNDPKDIYSLANLEKEMFGDKDHWKVMTDLLNNIYPGLYNTLKAKYPDMNELEYRVYMLSNFKLSRIDEALLLNVSTSVLDKARGKVKKLMEQENLFASVK